jgi:hypothetical protein
MLATPPAIALLAWLGLGLGFAAAAPAEAAVDDDATAPGLRWAASPPAECPSSAAIDRRVDALLGGPLAERGRDLAATASLAPADDGGWILDLEIRRDGHGERRELRSDDCSALADALALVLAVLADPLETSRGLGLDARFGGAAEPPAEPPILRPSPLPAGASAPTTGVGTGGTSSSQPAPNQPRGAAPRRVAASSALAPAPRRTPLRWSARIAGGPELGALPAVSGGLAAAITVRRARFQGELTGLFLFPRTAPIAEVAGAEVWSRLGVAGLRGCGLAIDRALAVPLCVGVEAGAVEGEGRGVAAASHQRRPWLAAVVAPSLRWSFAERLALFVGVEVAAPLLAASFVVVTADPDAPDIVAHRPAPVSGRLLVGFEARLAPAHERASERRDNSGARRRTPAVWARQGRSRGPR